jgi:SAM-dependent methyltransferase
MRAAAPSGGGLYGCGRLAGLEGAPLRPGGLALTEELIGLAGFRPGDHVADIGCGLGASTRLLTERGVSAVGVDIDAEARADGRAPALIAADAQRLPFADGRLDGVLAECVLSVLSDRSAALAEWARVLKAGGRLALSDVYARAGDSRGRLATLQGLSQAVVSAGLIVERREDRSEVLKRWVAEFIFGYGSLDALCGGMDGLDATALRLSRPGYCLIVARKPAAESKDALHG